MEHLVAGPSLAYILWPAILGYLRIVTHPNVLGSPLSADEAMSNIEALIAPSHLRVAGESNGFWASFRTVAADVKPRGNSVPDAHLVALCASTACRRSGDTTATSASCEASRSETRPRRNIRGGSK
ncbi:MAG: hypothetical protein LC733_06455 [Actinobacteria bacterium]|nr:hypothetical protein [Actinomycetota bacterium]